MYYLFTHHHLTPMEYYKKGRGEKIILRAFFLREIEDEREAQKAYKLKGG